MKHALHVKVITACLFAALSLSFFACQKTELPQDVPVIDTDPSVTVPEKDQQTPPEESEADENKEELPVPEIVPEVRYYNKLTGLECSEEIAGIRPIAMMINNIQQATPQQGISHADVIYEVLAEGGITRLLCLFTDYKNLPETGSIRSSRDYYIDLSDAHDAIYVHCGGSPVAYETLAARKTENMDGIYFNTPFYRNAWRKQHMGMEHSMMTTGEKLVQGISEKGYRTESDAVQPLRFADSRAEFEGDAAENLSLKFSYYATSVFAYDQTTDSYLKSQFGGPHIDSNDNSQLAFTNVLVLYADQGAVKGDDKGRLYVNFTGTGNGIYLAGGKTKPVIWSKESRTSSYTLLEADGVTELLLNPGKTYIGIAPMDAQATIS